MKRGLIFVMLITISIIAYAQNFYDDDDRTSLIGGSLGMAFSGGESDPELNASLVYLFHKLMTSGVSVEAQCAAVISTAPSYGDGWKFILPIDSRIFLGTRTISSFVGIGIEYTTVSPGDKDYDEPRLNQFASNVAIGAKVGFWKERRHSFILGTKFHFPIAHSDGLSDKTVVAIIGGVGFTNSWGAIKIDYEYPFGKGYANSVYGINSQALSCSVLFNI